jgi:hypothetical protein
MRTPQQGKDQAASKIEVALEELTTIANLPGLFSEVADLVSPSRRRDYAAFWRKVTEVNELFQEHSLAATEYSRLRSRLSDICASVKDLQERERQGRESESTQNRDLIRSTLREARKWVAGASTAEHLTEGRKHIARAQEMMRDRVLVKEHQTECWNEWKEVNEELSHRGHELSEQHYDALKGDLGPIAHSIEYGNPHEALSQIREARNRARQAYLTREHRDWLNKELQEYYEAAIRRIEERRADRARMQHEREAKREAWHKRMEEKIDQRSDWISNNEQRITRIRDEIDDLENQIAGAWNPDWAERARAWIEDKYDKIADLERKNLELEREIREIREK